MKAFDYSNLTWEELLKKTKDWFNAPRAITEALRRLKTLFDNQGNGYEPPYKVYIALLNQISTDPPTAIVLENTLGFTPTFSYTSVGDYTLNGEPIFDVSKTFLKGDINSISGAYASMEIINPSTIRILSEQEYGISHGLEDEYFVNTPIEIRVYN